MSFALASSCKLVPVQYRKYETGQLYCLNHQVRKPGWFHLMCRAPCSTYKAVWMLIKRSSVEELKQLQTFLSVSSEPLKILFHPKIVKFLMHVSENFLAFVESNCNPCLLASTLKKCSNCIITSNKLSNTFLRPESQNIQSFLEQQWMENLVRSATLKRMY